MSSSASVPLGEGSSDTAPLEEGLPLETPVVGVGQVIAGKYLVESLVRAGGMGVVLSARHLQLGERVALKVLHGGHAKMAGAVARFLREARAAARIKSEHVVRSLDFGTLECGDPYLVMEFLEGYDLRMLLRERRTLTLQESIQYLLQVCRGLEAAHALRIVHRDLKPSNLFLTQTPQGTPLIKILDFGIAKALEPAAASYAHEETITCATDLLGSPAYMSPEQIRAASRVDERTDIWALGVIFYELLSGQMPFEGETVSALLATIAADAPVPLQAHRPDLPPAVAALIGDCLQKDPNQRIPNVSTLAARLQMLSSPGESFETSSRLAVSSDPSVDPPAPKRRGVWIAGALAAALAGALAIQVSLGSIKRKEAAATTGLKEEAVAAQTSKPKPSITPPPSSPPATVTPVTVAPVPPPIVSSPPATTSPPARVETRKKQAVRPRSVVAASPVTSAAPVPVSKESTEANAIARRK